MFANLKNKLIEEVKASPSKFQQFANAAQAAVSSSSSTTPSGSDSTTTTNENFFSITEEDTPQNSPYKPLRFQAGASRGSTSNVSSQFTNNGGNTGAIPRTRRLSNSSMASDISFRLPTYDTPASAYHLQSDLDISASEVEDSASSVKLDTISKAQLYDAYKKSLDRYHKYRCRYTDLAKKYKDLERDSTKARSVLVETQEKALRRISELREQCTLEQQAKAHLEEALRIEMDDMQCKMQAYQTKLMLLGENPEQISAVLAANGINPNEGTLIDLSAGDNEKEGATNFNKLDTVTKDQVTRLEQQLTECEDKLKVMTKKFEEATATIELLRKQEEENALLLAQTKQAIYTELESKDSEVRKLQDAIKQLQSELQNATTKEKQFSVQAKQELNAKVIASEHMLAELREKYNAQEKILLANEEKLSILRKESEQKLADMRHQNVQLSEMIERYQRNEVSLAEIDNELNRTKNENDTLRASLEENQQKLRKLESEKNAQIESHEQSRDEERLAGDKRLKEVETKLQEYVKQLSEAQVEKESMQLKMQKLEAQLQVVSEQYALDKNETIAKLKHDFNTIQEEFTNKEKELKAISNKHAKQRKQHESQQAKIKEQTDVIEKLHSELAMHEQNLQAVQLEYGEREEQTEREKNELKQQVTNILHEIAEMEQQMRVVQQSHYKLEQEKQSLEIKIENMQIKTQDAERLHEQLDAAKAHLAQMESKLQIVESENSQLADKNCLLEENSNRLEKLIAEGERDSRRNSTMEDEATASEMRLKLQTAEDAVQKLNDKLTQVLDENSRMHNAQELMDHDHRTLQDKCDALEKEKLAAIDAQKCLEEQKLDLETGKSTIEAQLKELCEKLKDKEEQLEMEKIVTQDVRHECQQLSNWRQNAEHETVTLREQLAELQKTHLDYVLQVKLDLEAKQKRLNELENQQDSERALNSVQEKLQKTIEDLEQRNAEILLLTESNKHLSEELQERANELQNLQQAEIELLVAQKNLQIAAEELKQKNEELVDNDKLKHLLAEQQQRIDELESHQQTLKSIEEKYNALQDDLQKVNEDMERKNEELSLLRENQTTLNQELKSSANELQQKLTIIEQLQLESKDFNSRNAELNDCKVNIAQLKAALIVSKQELEALASKANDLEIQLKISHNDRDIEYQERDDLKMLVEQMKQAETKNTLLAAEQAQKLAKYEQLHIENEFLSTSIKQLEGEREQLKQSTMNSATDTVELRDKLKSIQCELYVLQGNADKHNLELEEKQEQLKESLLQLEEVRQANALERAELSRQTEHVRYITERNDSIQKELLHAQQQFDELERKQQDTQQQLQVTKLELEQFNKSATIANEVKEQKIVSLSAELANNQEIIEMLQQQVTEITAALQAKQELELELNALKVEQAERAINTKQQHIPLQDMQTTDSTKFNTHSDAEHLRKLNATLQHELEELKYKSAAEISSLQQEIEDMQSTNNHMTEKMVEYERLRTEMEQEQLLTNKHTINSQTQSNENNNFAEDDEIKLKNIMQEVQDVSNRNLFLEQKCENYLILEQSNERLKLQNAKLLRQLDETLVSMQHNESITANTEFEYLKNIMFQYLTGSGTGGNNETLVKVISAVLKFSPQQTQVAIEKEHQRRSLLNKIL